MTSRRTFGTTSVPAVLLLLFLCCVVPAAAWQGMPLLPLPANESCSPTVYVGGRKMRPGIAQDETHLYFADLTGLYRIPKSGGEASLITPESINIGGIAVDGTHVYYSALRLASNGHFEPGSGVIRAVPKAGGSPVTLASGLNGPAEVRVDATHVYWNNLGTQQSGGSFNPDGSMARIAKSGGAVEVLVSGIYGTSPVFDMDDQFIYYGENGGAVGGPPSGPRGVRRIPKGGGAVFSITDSQPAYSIFLEGDTIFFSVGFGLAIGQDAVYSVPAGGGPLTLYTAGGFFVSVVGVSDGLLYINYNNNCGPAGSLATIPVGSPGAAPTLVKANLDCGPGYQVLFDACSVYFRTNSTLERVCKPQCSTTSDPPTVTSITPTTGPVSGGTAVTITGSGFLAGATVTIGGVAATNVNVVNATTITATTPAVSASGPADVVVTNPGGASSTLAGAFSFTPAETSITVTSITPTSGPASGGTAVIITGSGFVTGATVSIGGAPAQLVTVTSATEIRASTPPHAAGVVDVVVTNPNGQSATLSGAFTYAEETPPPVITSISPSSGPASGGTQVTITGSGFRAGAIVSFGGVDAATSVTSGTGIRAVAPAHAPGAVDVRVRNVDGQSATVSGGFTYIDDAPPPAPVVTSISPASGTTEGGTAVTISGSNFAAGATVMIGGTAATDVVVVSATSITAVTPAHSAGAADVVVTNPDGQSATLPAGFTFVAPPPPFRITSVAPAEGPTRGGTEIVIHGSGFESGATVTLGGTAAANVRVVDSNTIVAITRPRDKGVVDVVVTNPGGSAVTLPNGYRYTRTKGIFF